jgi:hypothetical protein
MQGILCMGLISVIDNNFVLHYQQLQVPKLELNPKPYAAMSDSGPEVTTCEATLYICNFQFYSLTCKLRLILLSRLKSTETVTCSGYVGFWTQKTGFEELNSSHVVSMQAVVPVTHLQTRAFSSPVSRRQCGYAHAQCHLPCTLNQSALILQLMKIHQNNYDLPLWEGFRHCWFGTWVTAWYQYSTSRTVSKKLPVRIKIVRPVKHW